MNRIKVKVFLVAFCLSVIAFLVIFAVGMALIYEHRLISARLTEEFFLNFIFSMVLYFLATATYSFLTYRLLKRSRTEVKIFIFAYGLSFITFFVTMFFLIPIYYGHVPFLWIDLSFLLDPYSSFQFSLFIIFLGLLSLLPAAFFIVIYEIYRVTVKSWQKAGISRKKVKDEEKM